jgi:hypothetical protein
LQQEALHSHEFVSKPVVAEAIDGSKAAEFGHDVGVHCIILEGDSLTVVKCNQSIGTKL